MMSVLLSLPTLIIPMAIWLFTPANDLAVIQVAIVCMVVEAWKSTSTGFIGMLDFILSLAVAVGSLFIALTVPMFDQPMFYTLVMFAFADVASGGIVTMRAARRDIGFNT